MNISFTGAHSTGKSTLLTKCREIYGDRFQYIPEVTRALARKGLKINSDQADNYNMTQMSVINSHVENSLLDNVILDRCIIDGVVYTRYLHEQGKVSDWVFEYACHVHNTIIDRLDIVFFTQPDIPLIDDGQRSTDRGFRDKIIEYFDEHINGLSVGGKFKGKIVKLRGTIKERTDLIINTIN